MSGVTVGGERSWYPTVPVQVSTARVFTSERRMVVDTGAAAIVLPWSLAIELNIASAAASAPTATFSGLSATGVARRMNVDLLVGGEFNLVGVPVFFLEETELVAGYSGLLGQLGFFDRITYGQSHATLNRPFFTLEDSSPDPLAQSR